MKNKGNPFFIAELEILPATEQMILEWKEITDLAQIAIFCCLFTWNEQITLKCVTLICKISLVF
ncbi:hypothetical protein C9J01_17990 [Photobacterium rosenbergii]|uniref:Uncharacterized protein n=1 Tax=Photobacterium rosenbergii TaxID=294936 RepID=A0A2T3NAW5_9GAMM|nr:hypothetical protein C9J01_17990 [Photobacterium rosenbergii]